MGSFSTINGMRRREKIVYAVRNMITDKSYIGFCVCFKERKAAHLSSAKKGVNTKFYGAIRKYGAENFKWSILFDNLGTIENCKVMEIRMIALFDTYQNGYNGTIGGDGGCTYNPEIHGELVPGGFRKGQIPWNKGKKMSAEHCDKLSKGHKGVPLSKEHAANIGKSNTGCICTEETKKKISTALKGRKYPESRIIKAGLRKRVQQCDLHGVIIAEYVSLHEASSLTGVRVTGISSVLNGRYKHSGGYLWNQIN